MVLKIETDSGVPAELFEDWKEGKYQEVVDDIFNFPSKAESLYIAVGVQGLIKDWEYSNPDSPRFMKSAEYADVYRDSDIFAYMLFGKYDGEAEGFAARLNSGK